MPNLEQSLRKSTANLLTLFGGTLLAAMVFASMGLMHFDIERPTIRETAPLNEFHLPPPPPPPKKDPPPKESNVSISFNIPAGSDPSDIPLGFLEVDFGLKPKQLAQARVNVDESLANYKTDGLDTLKIYSQSEVTEKPRRTYQGNLDIPAKYSRLYGRKPITFVVLYTVTAQGKTTNIHVLDCPYPEVVPYIQDYISSWRLKPATKDGKPVNSWVQHKFTYHPSATDIFSL